MVAKSACRASLSIPRQTGPARAISDTKKHSSMMLMFSSCLVGVGAVSVGAVLGRTESMLTACRTRVSGVVAPPFRHVAVTGTRTFGRGCSSTCCGMPTPTTPLSAFLPVPALGWSTRPLPDAKSLLPALSSRKLRLRPVCDTGEVRVDEPFTGDWLPSRLGCWLPRRLGGTKVGVADPPGDGAADVRLEAPDLPDIFSLNAVPGAVLVGFATAVSGFGCLNVFSTPFASGDTRRPGECGLEVGSWRLGAALMRTCLRSSGEVSARDGA